MAVRVKFPKREIPGISLISLANLGFIIAIFLILAIKFKKNPKIENINLPVSSSAFEILGQKRIVDIVVLSSGDIYVDGVKINSVNDLESFILPKMKGDLTIFIKADKNINVGIYVDLIEKLRKLGINKIALITGG